MESYISIHVYIMYQAHLILSAPFLLFWILSFLLSNISLKRFTFLCVSCLCGCTRKQEESTGCPEAGLQVVVRPLTWMLATKLESCEGWEAPLTTEPFLQHCPTLPLLKWFSYYDKGYVQKHDDVFGCFDSGLQTAQAGFKFTLWLRLTSTSNLPASTLEAVLCHHIQVLGEESGALCSLDKHSKHLIYISSPKQLGFNVWNF